MFVSLLGSFSIASRKQEKRDDDKQNWDGIFDIGGFSLIPAQIKAVGENSMPTGNAAGL